MTARLRRLAPVLVLLLALGPWQPATAAVPGPEAEPPAAAALAPDGADEHGQLRVCGLQLCGENGEVVQLRGMSSHGLQWYADCMNDASLDALAEDWQANVVRLSTYVQEGGYETDPEGFTQLVGRLIEAGTARGLYIVVDWHILSPGDPYQNLDRAERFFTDIAGRYGGQDNLLYEIANEPNGVSWGSIASYAEDLIPTIRATDPETPVIVGTRAWSSLGVSEGADESEVVQRPVRADNVLYSFHFYAASHREAYLDSLRRASEQVPMIVTEFGTQDYSGDGGNDFAMADRYIQLMNDRSIGWISWNYSDDHRSGAVFEPGTCPGGSYAGTSRLKPAGVWVRDQLRSAATG
ncbi:glycoside hydrolase family 5 protein [Phycicoccus sp. CSK15P-2]|uniref:glycoside hydrolase family 5 protein n=1 Tax=Phycicoccus sp. CSK15P-2 TaxID=2807627 RepID=UPI00194DC462|nr:glycoside hydrolase family 5 protein [Phycicoccus sp. CSK15P-2]MBM6406110.1 glycoside hydrolase family 5 protein [Phycicoccus sp. CSK15P-2]